MALTAVATVAAAASAPGALQVPPLSTPQASTPAVTVPSVQTPVATTPSVTTPPASAPQATTPSASAPPAGGAPKVTAPKVTAPKVSTPSVSGPSTPKSSQSNSVTVGGGGVAKAVRPTVSGAVGGLAGTAGGTAVKTQGATAGGATGTAGNPALAPVFGGTPGGPGGGGFAGPGGTAGFFGPGGFGGGPGSPMFSLGRTRLGAGSGGVTAFAAAVGALAGCFYALTPLEQQVLIVRTGLDGRQPLSRSQVASQLGTTSKEIRRTERGALGRLRTAAATDGCMPVGPGSPANAVTAFIGGAFGPLGAVTPGVPPVSRSEPSAGGGQLASTSFADRLASLPGGSQEASLSILVVIAVMLSGALAALLLEARRQVH